MLEYDTGPAVETSSGVIVRDMVALADWRRRVYELYATVRSMSDPAQAWRAWRNRRDALMQDHPQSPLSSSERATFPGLPYFGYNAGARHLVDLEPVERDAPETQSLRDDGKVRLSPFARTRGLQTAFGGELTVYWIAGYGGGIFLPFADATSGNETFGGGRYLLDGIKGADLGSAATSSCSISTSLTTRPAPTARAGAARWRRRTTACRNRCARASGSAERHGGQAHPRSADGAAAREDQDAGRS
jgi:uncharacterized protein